MKILFITRTFPPTTGGMEMAAKELHQSLSKIADVDLIKWGGSKKLLPIVLPAFFFKASWLLMTKKFDAIYIHDGVLSPLGLTLKMIFRKPTVVTIHGLDITYNKFFFQNLIPPCVNRLDTAVCVSGATREQVVRRASKVKSIVIPNGVNDTRFNKKSSRKPISDELGFNVDDKKIIITVGRVVKRKGSDWFVSNVLKDLVKKNKDVIYLVVGMGPHYEATKEAISKNNLSDNAFMLGRVSDELLESIYNAADIFAMPNVKVPGDMEGFGLVALEAASCAIPVVASGIEGIKDAITNEKNGFLLKSKNSKAYIETCSKLLGDAKYAKRFGNQARKYTLKNYSWDTVAKRHIKNMEELING